MVTQLSSTKVAVKSFTLLDKGWIWTPKRSTKEEFPRDTELNHKKFSPLRKHIESCVPRHLQGTPPNSTSHSSENLQPPTVYSLSRSLVFVLSALPEIQPNGQTHVIGIEFYQLQKSWLCHTIHDGSLLFPFCRELKGPSQIHSRCLGKTSARSAEYQSQTHSWWPPF